MKETQIILGLLLATCVLVLIGSSIAHGHWFKCNDVIRYGVWQWCASYMYFRYVLGQEEEDISVGFRFDDRDDFLDNDHVCRGYGDKLYENNSDVPAAIIIGRVFILATHVSTICCLGTYFAALSDKIYGLQRKWIILAATTVQGIFYSVFCISMEAYLDGQETRINRTVVCWNGIIAWIGWCFCVIQVGISFAYFAMDDGQVEEMPEKYEEQYSQYVGGNESIGEHENRSLRSPNYGYDQRRFDNRGMDA